MGINQVLGTKAQHLVKERLFNHYSHLTVLFLILTNANLQMMLSAMIAMKRDG
jgi:hypothetical protein